jgi:large subunit ribosomal protein L29
MARKNKQKIGELRDLEDADLTKELNETHRQLFTARLQLSTRQLANTSLPRKARRKIARIKTVQREREIAALYEGAAGEGS